MKQTLTLLVIALTAAACNKRTSPSFEPSPQEIIVAGKIINGDGSESKVVTANFFNPFEIYSDSKASMIGSEGEFKITYEMPLTTTITIDYYSFTYAYLEPGDSIYLEINAKAIQGKDSTEAVKFSGDKADINNSLWKAMDYLGKLSDEMLYKPGSPSDTLTVEEFKLDIDNTIAQMNDSLAVFFSKNNTVPEAAEIVRLEVKNLISYYWVQDWNRESGTPEGISARNEIFTYHPFGTFDPESFRGQMFQYHLSSYAANIFSGDEKLLSLMSNDKSAAWSRVVEILSDSPSGFNRDYISYFFVRSLMPYPLDSLQGVTDFISSSYLLNQLNEASEYRMPAFDRMEINGITYLTPEGGRESLVRQDFIEYVASKYQGKVLYMDMWATWCGPCITEFPAANELKEKMKNEDVVFIYLCLRSPRQKLWLSLIEEHSLTGEHYFFDADATKLFMSNYYLNFFPSYIIVGKDGVIKSNRAPKPSQEKAMEEIKSFL